jgi:excisionase family DNA binding protein
MPITMPFEHDPPIPIELAAERRGLSHWTLRKWISDGRLSSFKSGRRVLVREREVRALMKPAFRPARRKRGR